MKFRNIITPFTMGAFVAVAVTGIALFYRWRVSFVITAHEWIGMTFIAAALWHGFSHIRSIQNYTRLRPSRATFFCALTAAIILILTTMAPDNGSPRAVLAVMAKHNVKEIVPLLSTTEEAAINALAAQGIHPEDGQSVEAAARAAGMSPYFALTVMANSSQPTAK